MHGTNEALNTKHFTKDDILSVTRKLNPNKAHGHNQISIHMLQICDKAIYKALYLTFSSCIELGIFPTEWKMASVVPICKRDDKHTVKNYQPLSLLPIFGKIFEHLIYNEMYSFFIENSLILQINQVLSKILVLISFCQEHMVFINP